MTINKINPCLKCGATPELSHQGIGCGLMVVCECGQCGPVGISGKDEAIYLWDVSNKKHKHKWQYIPLSESWEWCSKCGALRQHLLYGKTIYKYPKERK